MQTNPSCTCGNVAYRKSSRRGGRRRGYSCKRCGKTFWPITPVRMKLELAQGGVGERRLLKTFLRDLVTTGLR